VWLVNGSAAITRSFHRRASFPHAGAGQLDSREL
jgi:hypothetical protein